MRTATQTPRSVLALALHIRREAVAAREAYEAEVDAWYRSGDGRSPRWITRCEEIDGDVEVWQENVGGKGYAFPHCEHGSSRWTDYDNICGGCEDGFDPTDRRYCLDLAWNRYNSTIERMLDVTTLVSKHQRTMPEDLRKALVDWSLDGFPA